MNKNRYGNIRISGVVYNNDECVASLFEYLMLIPYRVENLGYSNIYDIYAVSDRFDEIEEGTLAPEYNIDITHDEESGYKFRVYKK